MQIERKYGYIGWEDIMRGEVMCKRLRPLACNQNLKSDIDIQSVWEIWH
jgi:hypothetical protein